MMNGGRHWLYLSQKPPKGQWNLGSRATTFPAKKLGRDRPPGCPRWRVPCLGQRQRGTRPPKTGKRGRASARAADTQDSRPPLPAPKISEEISQPAADGAEISADGAEVSPATSEISPAISGPTGDGRKISVATSQMSEGISEPVGATSQMSGAILEAGTEICPPTPAFSEMSWEISEISPAISQITRVIREFSRPFCAVSSDSSHSSSATCD